MIRDGRHPDFRHPGHVEGACGDPACAGRRRGPRRPGRPRSDAADLAILYAVLGLLS